VILSMGAEPKRLGIPGEIELGGRGVSTCGVCDGAFFKGENVAVIGGGDSAMEDSIFVSKFAKNLKIVHRRDEFRASKIMQDRVFADPKIEVTWNATVEEILGEGAVAGVRLRDTATGDERELATDGVFVAIGHTPNTGLFEGQLQLDAGGYVMVDEPRSHTSVPGVFAAGDVRLDSMKRVASAVGEGAMSIYLIHRYLATT
jgi:thioredoxin reductase (NADPH)